MRALYYYCHDNYFHCINLFLKKIFQKKKKIFNEISCHYLLHTHLDSKHHHHHHHNNNGKMSNIPLFKKKKKSVFGFECGVCVSHLPNGSSLITTNVKFNFLKVKKNDFIILKIVSLDLIFV